MRPEHLATHLKATTLRQATDLLVAVDVGSSHVGCAVAELGDETPCVIAAEAATSYGIRAGEIVDLKRASEAIRIAVESAAVRADAEVRSVIVGLSGDVKLSSAHAAMELQRERRAVAVGDMARLRHCLAPDQTAGRRVIHRFDGPYTVGDLQGIENPDGLCGERLEMHATFLSATSDRLDNLLKAVRNAEVDIEAVALGPITCSMGTLSVDERALGAAVLDFGAGAFRGGLWEGGRLRQLHIVGRDGPTTTPQSSTALTGPLAPAGGMEGVVLGLARRFRIAPATAERLLRSYGALGDEELTQLPEAVEVAAVDGLGSVAVSTRELSHTLEELLTPPVRSLREGLSGFSAGHAVGVVLTGGGARIKGLAGWVGKRFGGSPVRVGTPRWRLSSSVRLPPELLGSSGCSLAGLLALGAEGRAQLRVRSGGTWLTRISDRLRRLTAL